MQNLIIKIIDTFKKFISRDLLYIGSGLLILLVSFYVFNFSTIINNGNILINNILQYDQNGNILGTIMEITILGYVFFGIISYVIGFILQEIFTILGLIRTSFSIPTGVLLLLCNLFGPKITWKNENLNAEKNPNEICQRIFDNIEKVTIRDRIERIIHLKHLGSSMGPSFLISSIILATKGLNLLLSCLYGALFLIILIIYIIYFIIEKEKIKINWFIFIFSLLGFVLSIIFFIIIICKDCLICNKDSNTFAILSIITFIIAILLFITNQIKNIQHYLTIYDNKKNNVPFFRRIPT